MFGKKGRRIGNKTRQVLAEAIEGRLLLSTYTVNTLSDSASPGAGLLTLRQAVADANANPARTRSILIQRYLRRGIRTRLL